jgi:hypothetical protein
VSVISDLDERLHPVEHESEHWSDSLYFNAWDPGSKVFLLTRIAVLANQSKVTAGVLAWRDGMPAYGYGREHDGVAPGDWDVMQIGGLAYRMEQACQRWLIKLDDPDTDSRAHLTWDGFTGCFAYDGNAQPLPKAVAWGHYEQTCRVTGDLVIRGERIRVDGVGQRDHSWGFRDWAGLRTWHWITGFFGTTRSFNVFHVEQPDGTITANGFVHDDGVDHAITTVDRHTDETDAGGPTAYRMTITLDGGRTFLIEGSAAGTEVPVRPHAGDTVVHEVPMALRCDGVDGFGIYELLDNR